MINCNQSGLLRETQVGKVVLENVTVLGNFLLDKNRPKLFYIVENIKCFNNLFLYVTQDQFTQLDMKDFECVILYEVI